MPTLRLDQIRSPELRALPRERTIFFLPLGAIEDHGDALPMALDLIEARSLSERAAGKLSSEGWHCVIAPSVPLAVEGNTGAGALRVRSHVLRDYLVDFSDSLARQGFRYFAVVSGNPGPRQLTVIEEAGKFLRKRHLRFRIFPNARAPMLISASSVLLDDAEKSLSHFFMAPVEHGGERDAGVALACAPEFVDEKMLRVQPQATARGSLFERFREGRAGKISGYWGNPARGDAAKGNLLLEEKAGTLAMKFRAAVEGGKPHSIFKSWYSLVPSNQSLFKIWILVVLLAIVLGAWVMLALNTFLRGADFT